MKTKFDSGVKYHYTILHQNRTFGSYHYTILHQNRTLSSFLSIHYWCGKHIFISMYIKYIQNIYRI